MYYYACGFRLKKRSIQINNSKRSFCRRLFIDFPQRFVLDLYNHNPDEFSYYGFWLFVGEQGSGKSISVVDFLRKIKSEYPYCIVKTNIDCSLQDEKIRSPHDIIFSDNGINGEIDFIDEIQNWFNSNESRDFPPEMIQEICQQRKQYKMLIGTSQKFNRLALPLREQVNFLCKPITLFGCLTVVRVYKPDVSDRDGKVSKQRLIRSYYSYVSCPFQFVGSHGQLTHSFKISDLPLTSGITYYLNVVYRDTTVQQVSAIHRPTYAFCYYDDVSQLDGNYTVAMSQAFTLDTTVYVPVKTDDNGNIIGDDGQPKKDSNGNPIRNSNNYSNDVINLKQGNTASDAYAQGGSATAQGGNAEVVNNNNPTFNNNPSITINGGGGSGSGSGSDDSGSSGSGSGFGGFGDLNGFKTALDGSKGFLSLLAEYDGIIPSSCAILLGAGVVAIIICRFVGR